MKYPSRSESFASANRVLDFVCRLGWRAPAWAWCAFVCCGSFVAPAASGQDSADTTITAVEIDGIGRLSRSYVDGVARVRPYVSWSALEYLRVLDFTLPGVLPATRTAAPAGPLP